MGIAITAVAVSAVVGGAVSYAGVKKNAASIDRATAANKDSTDLANQRNYAMWQQSKGVGSDGSALNVHLPAWANVATSSPLSGGPRRLVTKSSLSNQLLANPYAGVKSYSSVNSAAYADPTGGSSYKPVNGNGIVFGNQGSYGGTNVLKQKYGINASP